MDREFSVIVPEIKESFVFYDGVYEFKHDKPKLSRLLQKICLGILDRLGCQYSHKHYEYRRDTVVFTDIIEAIGRHRHAAEEVSMRKCKVVVLGADQIESLQASSTYFGLQFPHGLRHGWNLWQLMGMTVVFCPWMDGIVCLPDMDVFAVN